MDNLKKYIKLLNTSKNLIDITPEEEEEYLKGDRLHSDENLASLTSEVTHLYIKYREGKIVEKWELKDFIHKALLLHKLLYGKEHEDQKSILGEVS